MHSPLQLRQHKFHIYVYSFKGIVIFPCKNKKKESHLFSFTVDRDSQDMEPVGLDSLAAFVAVVVDEHNFPDRCHKIVVAELAGSSDSLHLRV